MSAVMCVVVAAILFAADQLVKLWAINSLAPVGTMQVIPGLLSLTYVENRGAAFGIFQGQRAFIIILVVVILGIVGWMLFTNRIKATLERVCTTMIIAGGLGNLVDRIRLGFVVDYIDINQLFAYPMFNLADCFVVVGSCLLVVSVMLEEKREKKTAEVDVQPENEAEEIIEDADKDRSDN